MKRSKLRNKYLRERIDNAECICNKQRNLCVSILLKNQRNYFENLNDKVIRKIWKIIRSLFSEKASHREPITLKESNKTIANNEELAVTFNTFFSKVVPNLKIKNNLGNTITNPLTDLGSCAIRKYENHQSILKTMGKKNLSCVLVITCLRGRFRINLLSSLFRNFEISRVQWERFQNFKKWARKILPKFYE